MKTQAGPPYISDFIILFDFSRSFPPITGLAQHNDKIPEIPKSKIFESQKQPRTVLASDSLGDIVNFKLNLMRIKLKIGKQKSPARERAGPKRQTAFVNLILRRRRLLLLQRVLCQQRLLQLGHGQPAR